MDKERLETGMHRIESNTDHYLSLFEQAYRSSNGNPKMYLLRKEALEKFLQFGFPSRKNEDWKFTDITPIANRKFIAPLYEVEPELQKKMLDQIYFEGINGPTLVFVNGVLSRKYSRLENFPEEIRLSGIRSRLDDNDGSTTKYLGKTISFDSDGLNALGMAFFQDGYFLEIPDQFVYNVPIQIVFLSTEKDRPLMIHSRNLVIVGKNSSVSLIESYIGFSQTEYFTNAGTEIYLKENSIFEHDKLQVEGENSFHVASIHVLQERNSKYISNSIALGGSIVRNNITSTLKGEGCETTLNGLSVSTGDQLIDNHTTIDHTMPHCSSHELYKAILDGKSRGVFNGKIFVRRDAQKTDAKQTNKTLLLSDNATIDTKPQLEIFADDVKCTHGATIGQLDAEQLFYFRSRGIGEFESRDILTFAFARDVVNKIGNSTLRQRVEDRVYKKLHASRGSIKP